MKIFTSKEVKTLQAEIAGKDLKISELQAELQTAKESAKDYSEIKADRDNLFNETQLLKEEKANHEKNVTELTTKHEKALADMKADYEKQISTLNDKVVKEAASSEAKAISTLAKIGVPADELPKVTTKDDTSILDNMAGLTGHQLSEYFQNNKAAIFAAMKLQKSAKQ